MTRVRASRTVHALYGAAAILATCLWVPGLAFAQAATPIPASEICESDDDDSKPKPAWKQFTLAGACVELSGSVSAIYQRLMNSSGGRVVVLNTRRGSVSSNTSQVKTGDVNLRADTTRKTSLGNLTTGFEVQYEKTSDDSGSGVFTLIEGIASWAGVNVGYTDSLMNFWSGDFQFSATAPARTVGLASYDFKFTDSLKLTIAAETGAPTTRSSSSGFMPISWDDPVISARLLSETDDLTVQLSAMAHQIQQAGSHPVLARFRPGASSDVWGWAATFGLTLPVPKISDGSEFSMQATYAVNASPYLGTAADLSSLASFVPPTAETRGWSAIGSYHHVWSEHWETNVMASRLSLEITLPFFAPKIDTMRYAANLIWKPVDALQVGGELGYLDVKLQSNGTIGLLSGASGQALVGYLFLTWTF